MKSLIEAWTAFCESLDTRGGTIALLFLSTSILGLCVLRAEHQGYSGVVETTFTTTFSGFTGALLLALTGKTKPDGGDK